MQRKKRFPSKLLFQVDDARLAALEQLANKLINEGHSDTDQVAARRDAVLQKWRGIQDDLEAYKRRLRSAEDIHQFRRDAADLDERIRERRNEVSPVIWSVFQSLDPTLCEMLLSAVFQRRSGLELGYL